MQSDAQLRVKGCMSRQFRIKRYSSVVRSAATTCHALRRPARFSVTGNHSQNTVVVIPLFFRRCSFRKLIRPDIHSGQSPLSEELTNRTSLEDFTLLLLKARP